MSTKDVSTPRSSCSPSRSSTTDDTDRLSTRTGHSRTSSDCGSCRTGRSNRSDSTQTRTSSSVDSTGGSRSGAGRDDRSVCSSSGSVCQRQSNGRQTTDSRQNDKRRTVVKPSTASSSSPDRSERKRQEAASASSKGKDDSEYDKRNSSQTRTEPKFEPRFSYYRSNPIEGVRRDTTYYNEHRKKISEAKPMIDTKPPPVFSHIHCNMKKLKLTQDRQDEIERDNKLLLDRLVRAMTTTRVDNWNDLDNRIVPSSRSRQRRQIVETASENLKMLKRIDSRKSTVSFSREGRRETSQSSHQRRLLQHRSAQQQRQGSTAGSESSRRQDGSGE